MTRETAGDLVHDVDVQESLDYLDGRQVEDYDRETVSDEAARAILVEVPEVSGDDIQFRYLREGEDRPFETVELEDAEGDYEVLK